MEQVSRLLLLVVYGESVIQLRVKLGITILTLISSQVPVEHLIELERRCSGVLGQVLLNIFLLVQGVLQVNEISAREVLLLLAGGRLLKDKDEVFLVRLTSCPLLVEVCRFNRGRSIVGRPITRRIIRRKARSRDNLP